MTELFISDLASRIPYGVKLFIPEISKAAFTLCGVYKKDSNYIICAKIGKSYFEIPDTLSIKPYLRSFSSITAEEYCEYENYILNEKDIQAQFLNQMNFYNRLHFDYRGLIPMELAIAVTKENNPYKDK